MELTASPELGVYRRGPVEFVRGEGVELFDADGRRYLDLYAGHAVACLGHGDPGLRRAVEAQWSALAFQSNTVDMAVRREASRSLVEASRMEDGEVFWVNSGAEANEAALRAAFLATGRRKVVCVEGGFHGRSAAASAVTDGSAKYYGFPSTPFEVVRIGRSPEACAAVDSDTAAMIVEPVQGVAGAVDLGHAFLAAAREACSRAGAALIVDEVQTGVGRTGTFFACEASGVAPDVLTAAKGLGGGFPVAAAVFSPWVASAVGPGQLGTTFGGGPVACAAAGHVVARVSRAEFLASVLEVGETVRGLAGVGPIIEVTGRGLLAGLRCDRPAREVQSTLLTAGIVVGDSADPDVVRLLPPLIVTPVHIEELKEALRAL
jgi:acetylornithine/N-succinyldiaminopimelate aminotransferase